MIIATIVGRETTESVALEKSILLAKMVWVYKVHAMKKSLLLGRSFIIDYI